MAESPGNFTVVELVHLCGNDGRDMKGGCIKTNVGKGVGKDGTSQIKFVLRGGRFAEFWGEIALFHNTDGFLGIVVNDTITGIVEEKRGDNSRENVEPVQSKGEEEKE